MYALHVIENEFLRVAVNPIGAELFSIFDKKDKMEMLWQGNSEFWGSRAPVLFPIVGGLKNNTTYYNNEPYLIPKHGIIRRNDQLELVEERSTRITYRLVSGPATQKVFPFAFVFEISFELQGNSLQVLHRVSNAGSESMYFTLGGHPAFNCPFYTNEKYEDYGIELELEENALLSNRLNADGLITDQTRTIALDGNWLPLTQNLFDDDALIFKTIRSRKATLRKRTGGKRIEVSFADFPFLGVWAKPGAPFVCIEPWLGYADSWDTNQQLQHKDGMLTLEPTREFNASYAIQVLS